MALNGFQEPDKPRWGRWLVIVLAIAAAVVGVILVRRPAPTPAPAAIRTPPPVAASATATSGVAASVTAAEAPASSSNVAAVVDLLAEGGALEKKEALAEARDKYLEALKLSAGDPLRSEIEERLGRVGIALVSTPHAMPEKVDHTVQKGDSPVKLAQKYGTTPELILKQNRIQNPSLLKIGDRLRILNGKFSLTVSKSRNDLVVKLNDRFFKRYRTGTGKYGKTPVGAFMVSERIPHPVWWRPDGKAVPYGDKENILGTHWLTLRAAGTTEDIRGYGIHGTWETNSIGKSESAGCVRMLNEQVEELYTILPVGTPVAIED